MASGSCPPWPASLIAARRPGRRARRGRSLDPSARTPRSRSSRSRCGSRSRRPARPRASAADFTLSTTGGPRRSSASTRSTSAARRRPGAAPAPPAARRRFLILFDFSFSQPKAVVAARRAAREFVLDGHGRHATSRRSRRTRVENGVRLLVDVLVGSRAARARDRDPRAWSRPNRPIRSQIAYAPTAVGPRRPRVFRPARQRRSSAERRQAGMTESLEHDGDPGPRARRRVPARPRACTSSSRFRELGRRSTPSRAARRSCLPFGGLPGRFLVGAPETTEEQQWLIEGEVWKVDADQRFGNTALRTELSEMGEFFRRSDCVIHAVDIGGHRDRARRRRAGRAGRRSAPRMTQNALFEIAQGDGRRDLPQRQRHRGGAPADRPPDQPGVRPGVPAGPAATGRASTTSSRSRSAAPGAQVDRGPATSKGAASGSVTPLERSLSAADVIANEIPFADIPTRVLAAPFAGPAPEERRALSVLHRDPGGGVPAGREGRPGDPRDLRLRLRRSTTASQDFLAQHAGARRRAREPATLPREACATSASCACPRRLSFAHSRAQRGDGPDGLRSRPCVCRRSGRTSTTFSPPCFSRPVPRTGSPSGNGAARGGERRAGPAARVPRRSGRGERGAGRARRTSRRGARRGSASSRITSAARSRSRTRSGSAASSSTRTGGRSTRRRARVLGRTPPEPDGKRRLASGVHGAARHRSGALRSARFHTGARPRSVASPRRSSAFLERCELPAPSSSSPSRPARRLPRPGPGGAIAALQRRAATSLRGRAEARGRRRRRWVDRQRACSRKERRAPRSSCSARRTRWTKATAASGGADAGLPARRGPRRGALLPGARRRRRRRRSTRGLRVLGDDYCGSTGSRRPPWRGARRRALGGQDPAMLARLARARDELARPAASGRIAPSTSRSSPTPRFPTRPSRRRRGRARGGYASIARHAALAAAGAPGRRAVLGARLLLARLRSRLGLGRLRRQDPRLRRSEAGPAPASAAVLAHELAHAFSGTRRATAPRPGSTRAGAVELGAAASPPRAPARRPGASRRSLAALDGQPAAGRCDRGAARALYAQALSLVEYLVEARGEGALALHRARLSERGDDRGPAGRDGLEQGGVFDELADWRRGIC